jgi:hypothetical protein
MISKLVNLAVIEFGSANGLSGFEQRSPLLPEPCVGRQVAVIANPGSIGVEGARRLASDGQNIDRGEATIIIVSSLERVLFTSIG